MAVYKTPGVYLEEVSLFPPSVAAVDTAVPAFVGYVSKAEKRGERLFVTGAAGAPPVIKPTLLSSLPEFELYFGREPHRTITVNLDANDEITGIVSSQRYILYDSIRMFFLNGGTKCYVVPVGLYGATGVPVRDELLAGLQALRKVDEPTLIVVPDAVSLAGNGQYEVYVQALRQCSELQDRFTICDLANVNGNSHEEVITEFRNNIGINNLSYGAAYTPWLKSTLARELFFRDIRFQRSGVQVFLHDFTNDYDIRLLIKDLNAAINAVNYIDSTIIGATPLEELFIQQIDAINSAIATYDPAAVGASVNDITTNQVRTAYNRITVLLSDLITLRDTILPSIIVPPVSPDLSLNQTSNFALRTDINNVITDSITDTFRTLVHHSNAAPLTGAVDIFTPLGTQLSSLVTALGFLATDTLPAVTALYPVAPTTIDVPAIARIAREALEVAHSNLLRAIQTIRNAAVKYEQTFDSSLPIIFGFYKNALSRITEDLSHTPPSGAIAGIYATVDAQRGVWKAPANVSLNGVNDLAFQIDNQIQEGLNVDANAGKSINAIRAFTGKGTLVWGARTLTGNDNEWRYIPVRRFFIFAEESIKKATEPFVFEPNDANTWVKIRAMIENFLTIQWRQGALAGAKPNEAFFVKVGLGQTMTSLDILEGRMIIEIGMAVVRPAEFIILRFSHKMQES